MSHDESKSWGRAWDSKTKNQHRQKRDPGLPRGSRSMSICLPIGVERLANNLQLPKKKRPTHEMWAFFSL